MGERKGVRRIEFTLPQTLVIYTRSVSPIVENATSRVFLGVQRVVTILGIIGGTFYLITSKR